ncbi:MAG: hypothetical protein B7Y37_01040 [Sphingobacteriia bacterium 28-36-52]|nr:MAG: hypothetical protein B7Y37_01040 [Sphingobacteriia bacterium 28-36-52]
MMFMKKNLSFILGIFSLLLFTSCVKDPINPGYAQYMFINAAPDVAAGVDFFVGDLKQNILPIAFGSNTGYNSTTPGTKSIRVTIAGQQTVFSANNYNVSDLRDQPARYTLLAVNKIQNAELVWIQDNLTTPAAGKAHLRIIHASADAPAVNAYVGTATTAIFPSALSFKGSSSFVPLNATLLGTPYSIQIRNATTNAIIRTQPMTAVSGKIYTIVVRGSVTPSPWLPANTVSTTLVANN